MTTTTVLDRIEAMLAELPVADREGLLEAIESYGDLRADEARTA